MPKRESFCYFHLATIGVFYTVFYIFAHGKVLIQLSMLAQYGDAKRAAGSNAYMILRPCHVKCRVLGYLIAGDGGELSFCEGELVAPHNAENMRFVFISTLGRL